MTRWEKVIEIRTAVNGALEAARAEKKIGKALEAKVVLTVCADDAFLTQMDSELLADLLIVSQVEASVGEDLSISVENAVGEKCPRCWKHSVESGQDGLCPRCAAVIERMPKF